MGITSSHAQDAVKSAITLTLILTGLAVENHRAFL